MIKYAIKNYSLKSSNAMCCVVRPPCKDKESKFTTTQYESWVALLKLLIGRHGLCTLAMIWHAFLCVGSPPYINQEKGGTLAKKSRKSRPETKGLVGIRRVAGSTHWETVVLLAAPDSGCEYFCLQKYAK
eukprot:1141964-Pelagomonas_calceolata.AAC.6